MNDIRNYDPEDGSYGKRMSRYVGDLNSRRIPNTITWSIICRAPTYSPVTKSCRLCLMEKFMIMFESSTATLNVKSEFFSSCLHKKKLLLKNHKKRKPGWKGRCRSLSFWSSQTRITSLLYHDLVSRYWWLQVATLVWNIMFRDW